jgi:hypothetical protein
VDALPRMAVPGERCDAINGAELKLDGCHLKHHSLIEDLIGRKFRIGTVSTRRNVGTFAARLAPVGTSMQLILQPIMYH